MGSSCRETEMKEYYNFAMFAADVEKIAAVIRKVEEKEGRKFTRIYGPPRGGLPLAVCLSHRLNLKLLLFSPLTLLPQDHSTPLLDTSDIYYKNLKTVTDSVLVVDDIADTGKTLQAFHSAGFFIATLYKHPQSAFEPNIWCRTKHDSWIEFWWEADDLLLNAHMI